MLVLIGAFVVVVGTSVREGVGGPERGRVPKAMWWPWAGALGSW